MAVAPDPGHEARRAHLRQLYATWLAGDVAALKAARAATFRRDLPGCALGAGVVLLAAIAILTAARSHAPWSDPWVIGRVLVGVTGLAWFTRRFLLATHDRGDDEMHAQDRQLDLLVRRLVAQVRPGASYEPSDRLEEDWPAVARLVDANRRDAPYVVRWTVDDVQVAAAEARASFYRTAADGTRDDPSGDTRFAGWVAVARLPPPREWAVRVRSRTSAYRDTCDDARFDPVRIPELDDRYDVRATGIDGVTQVVGPDVIAQLAAAARHGHAVHLAAAGTMIVVALERAESWFDRLHPRLDVDHAVVLGETLDTLHAVMEAAVRSLQRASQSR